MNIILKIAAFYEMLVSAVSNVSAGPMEAVALTAVFVVIAGLRTLYLWLDFIGNDSSVARGLVMFAKAQFRTLLIWFLVGASPVMFSALAMSTSGRLKGAGAPLAVAGQGVFDICLDSVSMIWALRGTVQNKLRENSPYLAKMISDEPEAADATDGFIEGRDYFRKYQKRAVTDAKAQLAAATADSKSKNPSIAKMGLVRIGVAQGQIDGIAAADNAVKAESFLNRKNLDEEAGKSDAEILGEGVLKAAKIYTLPGAALIQDLVTGVGWAIAFVGSLLVIGPALFLAVSALMKIITGMMELFTFVFGFIAMIVVVGAFSVGLAPLAMMSFISDQWSKYGWNFIGFWLQAVIASLALVSMLGMASTAIGHLGNMIATAGMLVAGGAVAGSSAFDMAKTCLLSGLIFLAVGSALSFFTALLQKALSGAIGMVNGSLHP